MVRPAPPPSEAAWQRHDRVTVHVYRAEEGWAEVPARLLKIETADYFAKALELCGAGAWIKIQVAIPMKLRTGWNTIAKEKASRLLCRPQADAEGQAPSSAHAADRHEPQQ